MKISLYTMDSGHFLSWRVKMHFNTQLRESESSLSPQREMDREWTQSR